MDELKPCPFCGSEVHRVGGEYGVTIECTGCSYTFYDWSDGDTWWNTRPGEAAAEQRGYERALDVAIEHFRGGDNWDEWAITEIEKVRAEYLKEEGKNGKTE